MWLYLSMYVSVKWDFPVKALVMEPISPILSCLKDNRFLLDLNMLP